MRILFVTPYFPVPANDGSKIRDYFLIRELSRLCDVYLLSFVESESEDANRAAMLHWCQAIETVRRRSANDFPRSVRFIRNVFSPWPFAVQDFWNPKLAARLALLCREWQIDVVQLQKLQMVLYRRSVPSQVICTLDHHNVDSILWRRYLEATLNPLAKSYLWLQWYKTRSLESNLGQWFEQIFTVSEFDASALRELAGPHFTAVPIGIDLDTPADSLPDAAYPKDAQAFDVVYSGSMGWYPNQDAVMYFAREVFPHVRAALPGARFLVVGRDPPASIRRLATTIPGVIVTGSVPDVRPFLAGASVVVAPTRIGSGTKVKVLEAMAMGKAVVATPEASEGLTAVPGTEILVAASAAQFCDCILDLARNPLRRASIGQAARIYVESKHSAPDIARQLHSIYVGMLAENKARDYDG
jgi:polysaccharide biosynthesis protein PslH